MPSSSSSCPSATIPDGLCVGADGRLYVATTYAHCVTVVEDGAIVDRYMCADGMATNCCFGDTDLYVTESRHGTLWRYPLGVIGLPLRAVSAYSLRRPPTRGAISERLREFNASASGPVPAG